jgi:SprT-like protein
MRSKDLVHTVERWEKINKKGGNCMKKMSNVELTKICKVFCRELWNHELSIPVKIDGKITNSLAYFRHYGESGKEKRENLALDIKFSRNLFEYYDEKIIKSVILHELTHYYLFISGSTKYSDGEKDFEEELSRIGSHSTGKVAFCGKIYFVYCSHCKKIVETCKTKAKAEKICRDYRSGCHKSTLNYYEKIVKVPTEELIAEKKTSEISEILGK